MLGLIHLGGQRSLDEGSLAKTAEGENEIEGVKTLFDPRILFLFCFT